MQSEKNEDAEKSIFLAGLVTGWVVESKSNVSYVDDAETGQELFRILHGKNVRSAGLYDPACMALAWSVLNWALRQPFASQLWTLLEYDSPLRDGRSIFEIPAADAQRAFLDEIVRLAHQEIAVDEKE